MPEGPEVAKYTDWLVSKLKVDNKWLSYLGIQVLNQKRGKIDMEHTRGALDTPIFDIECKGKHFFIRLTENICIHAHLLMGGSWCSEETDKSVYRFIFGDYRDGIVHGELVNIYYNMSGLAKLEIFQTLNEYQTKIDSLAPGFIGKYLITETAWMSCISKFTGRRQLRTLLFDQQALVSGIGNYLWAEILYRAKLMPTVTLKDLDEETLRNLYHVCKNTVQGFYNGTYKKLIYGQSRDPDGNEIKQLKQSGRTTWYVDFNEYK